MMADFCLLLCLDSSSLVWWNSDDGQLYTCVDILIIGCFYMIPRVRI